MRNARSTLCTVTLFSLATALAACGSTATPEDGSGGDASDAGGTGLGPRNGNVTVSQLSITAGGMTINSGNESASFSDVSMVDGGLVSTVRTDGPCTVVRIAAPSAANLAAIQRSAGAVTVMGGSGAAVTLTPDSTGTYAGANQMAVRWSPGDMISVSAAGADVPAFMGALAFPVAITLSAPTQTVGTPVPLDRAMGLPVAWSGGEPSGSVEVAIAQSLPGSGGSLNVVEIGCTFPASARSGMVPATALADLSTATGGGDGGAAMGGTALVISSINQQMVAAGGYRVTLSAANVALVASAMVQ